MNKLKVKDKRFELVDSSTLDSDLVVRPNLVIGKMLGEGLKRIQLLLELYVYYL